LPEEQSARRRIQQSKASSNVSSACDKARKEQREFNLLLDRERGEARSAVVGNKVGC